MSGKLRLWLQVAILITLPICSSLCIDMYLPAYNSIAASFHVRPGMMDLTMSTYLIGLSFGQLIYGPLSDRYGRKKILLPGLFLYCVASLVCTFATSFDFFLVGRLFQAIGACSASVICRAIVADSFPGKQRTQMLALISSANIFSPALAPIYGGLMAAYFNWRMIFLFITLFSIVISILAKLFLKESLPKPDTEALKMPVIFKNLKRLGENQSFVNYILILGLLYVVGYSWILLSPSVLLTHFKVLPQNFGDYYLLPAIGSCLGALFIAKFSPFFNTTKSIKTGLLLILTSALLLVMIKNFIVSPLFFMTFIMIIFFSNGLINPQIISEAIGEFLDIGGLASSIIGFSQTIFGAMLGLVASYFYSSSMEAIGIFMLLPAVLAYISFFMVAYRKRQAYMVRT